MADHAEVEFSFSVVVETAWGEQVRVVGALDALGTWHPSSGLELSTGQFTYPQWSGTLSLPATERVGAQVEYKFVIQRPDGSVVWEPGPNRCLWLLPLASKKLEPSPFDLPLRFGETEGAELQALLPVLRQESSTSTCEPAADDIDDDDSRSTVFASRDASSNCLLHLDDRLCESSAEEELWLCAGAHRAQKAGGDCEDSFFLSAHA
eukprot:CAMPEP_0168419264 /NCGR_PEP_ID=MMETSP0228-20121227/32180_1 /TAXON_ID=133427 /ORGANISM="Protoceratium reticulatum, Strain CCCM 535 (=CCMP 1889)" /LENGTH=206 /DNA_ID=CAMNT_0008433143 /DNA_START=52 /DNA_END=669 /DNA_ORIENTATION=+